MRWVTSARYKDHEGEIGISFAPEIAQFLVQLKKHFTSYQLKQASALRSVYSWRLFENLKSHESLGEWRVEVDRFHKVMETPKSYQKELRPDSPVGAGPGHCRTGRKKRPVCVG